MNKDQLREIVAFWSFWDKAPPPSIKRNIELPQQLSNSLVLAVTGPRRSGKSTLLAQLIDRYQLPAKNCAFVNFEDPKLTNRLSFELLDEIFELFTELQPKSKRYFFFDEIQNVSGWEKWLHTRLERPGNNYFIITGSNSSLLSGELSSSLTGRHLSVELLPFSFNEFLNFKPKGTLTDYLHHGGFPKPMMMEEREILLKQYFNDIIERDIRERLGARSSTTIRQVLQMAYETTGSEISLRRIASATSVAPETVSGYLNAANAAYLIFPCSFFAYSIRKRANYNKKYYPVDPGLFNSVVSNTGKNLGKKFEITVLLELRRRSHEVFYWRDRGEVDFVITTGTGPLPVQVSLEKEQERHRVATDNFYETFPNSKECIFINKNNFQSQLSAIDGIMAQAR